MKPMRNHFSCFAGLWVFVLLCGLLCEVSAAKSADQTNLNEAEKAEALSHFQKGQAQFAQKEYLLAVEHFKRAFEITQSPEILYNIAMCYEEQHENGQAVAYYREYLKDAEGKDAEEVRQKINALGGNDAAPSSDEPSSDVQSEDSTEISAEPVDSTDKETRRRLHHFSFELGMGPGFVLMTPHTNIISQSTAPEKRNYFAIDMLGHFFLSDWFAITGGLIVGAYIEGDTEFADGDPEKHLGLAVGVAMRKQVQTRVSIFTNLLAVPCAVWRYAWTKRATWIAFDIRFGMNIHLSEKWDVNLMAVAEGGPTFVINPRQRDWDNGIILSVGPRIGFTYTRKGK
jgi:hypothetical protein